MSGGGLSFGANDEVLVPAPIKYRDDDVQLVAAPANDNTFYAPESDEILQAPGGAIRQGVNLFARGAVDQGVLSGAEGLTRLAKKAAVDAGGDIGSTELRGVRTQLSRLKAREKELLGSPSTYGTFASAESAPSSAPNYDEIDSIQRDIRQLDERRQQLEAPIKQPFDQAAGAIAGARESVRQALPVNPVTQNSFAGQVVNALGQAVGSLPVYALPMVGPAAGVSMNAGQLFDQGYQDAKGKGADEEVATQAGMMNVPAAAIEAVADRLVIGRLKPVMGQFKVGQLLRAVTESGLAEGAAEGSSQLWQNVVAAYLAGYDPERPIDDGVWRSLLIGLTSAGILTGAGRGFNAATSRDSSPEASTESPRPAAGSDVFDPFATGQAEELGAPTAPAAAEASRSTVEQPVAGVVEARPTVDRGVREAQLNEAFNGSEWGPTGLVKRADLPDMVGQTDYAEWWANQIDGRPKNDQAEALQERVEQSDRAAMAERASELEVALKANQVATAEFARREDDVARPAAKLWSEVAMTDEAFQFPTTAAKEPEVIARDLSKPALPISAEVAGSRIRFSSPRGFIDLQIESQPSGGNRGLVQIKADDANSAGVAQGGGAALYQAALTWAHNNGYRAAPGESISMVNRLRRTSQMLSSALRFGTTDHMAPYRQQAVKWTPGDHAANIEALAGAEASAVTQAFPSVSNYAYDFSRGEFVDTQTQRPVSDDDLRSIILRSDPGYAAGVGPATLKRAILTRSALSDKGAQSGVLGSLLQRDPLPSRIAGVLYARREAEVTQQFRAELAQRQQQWRENAQRIAPGLMSRFSLEFGAPDQLVRMGRARTSDLTGYEEAAYLAHERMFFLFDEALMKRTEGGTAINLLHEMGHAHWDTLPIERHDELMKLWLQETQNRQGPLYHEGKLKRGVARGIDFDVKEWYAERLAWTNEQWARSRIKESAAPASDGLMGRLGQQFRALLQKMRDFVSKLRAEPIDSDFRAFLDSGSKFEAMTADVLEAPAYARRFTPEWAKDKADDFGAWLRRNMTSRAGLPPEVYKLKLEKDARLAAIAQSVRFGLRDIDRAIHSVYGGYKAMTPAQLAELNDVLGGKRPVNSVDKRLAAPLGEMRRQIDVLSRRLVREGAIDGNLAARVDGNLGFYLNRSYRKFDDKNWAKNVPEAVRNRAASFIRAELQSKQPGKPVDEREVQGYLDYMLSKDVAGADGFFKAGKEGSKDLSIFTTRKEIPEELRDLLGEYKDPRVNYLRSVMKTAQVLESHHFLKEVRAAGTGRWLFDRPISDATGSYSVKIAADSSEAMAPLNGLYTTAEIAEAFKASQTAAGDGLWKWWLAVNGAAKASKTVLNPGSHPRNFLGNIGLLIWNGHWSVGAVGDVFTAMRSLIGLKETAGSRQYVQRLYRLGVIGQSISSGELREALNDAGAKMQGFEEWTESRLLRAVKAPASIAARIYEANDELFKIFAFENERRTWAKAQPSLTAEQLDSIAAERVSNTMPTYSRIPRALQAVRRFAATGSFLSFSSEIIRVTYNSLRYVMGDLKSPSLAVKAVGAKRLAGMIAMSTIPAAVVVARKWAVGLDDDDEEDVRRFLPDYARNAALYFQSADKDGRMRLIDVSYLDPWSYMKKPITAAMRGEDFKGAVFGAGAEALSPFLSEGIVTKAVLDLSRNRDDRGRPIYNPMLPFEDQASAVMGHLWKVVEPGAITQAKRIIAGAKGEVKDSGRAYNLEDEVTAVLTGARRQSLDVNQALLFKVQAFTGKLAEAERIFTSVRDRAGSVDVDELVQAKVKMETARKALFAEISEDVAAAERLGVDRRKVLLSMASTNLSKLEMVMVVKGLYVPYIDRGTSKQRQIWNNLMRE